MKAAKLASAILMLFSVVSCGPKAFVEGDYDQDINKANLLDDSWSESDMQQAVEALVKSALAHPVIANAKTPPFVQVERLKNKTQEQIDTESVTDMVQVELQRGGHVRFVNKAAREDVATELEYQEKSGNVSKDSQKKRGNQIAADLFVDGNIDTIVKEAGNKKTVYYKVTLRLTNLSTNVVEWQDYKQIRKIFKKKSVGL